VAKAKPKAVKASKAKPKVAPSTKLRAQLRTRIRTRIEELDISRSDAADFMGLSIAQTSRLCNDYDAFSLDRLVDAAEGIGLTVEMRAVRPYSKD
jgi:predicted XRE-type DNA-binding protein